MTTQERRKIIEAITDCDNFINKEGPRNASLRPADMTQHLEFCKQHKAKLHGALVTGVWVV